MVFDEPWNELDPIARRDFSSELVSLTANDPIVIFVSSHDLEIVRPIAGTYVFVAGGRLAACGSLDAIAQEHRLDAVAPSIELYEKVVASCV
jgi:ABC-type multidrug transport system ATPase subunit